MSGIRRLDSVLKLEQMKRDSTGPIRFSQKILAFCQVGGTIGFLSLMISWLIALFVLNIAKIVMGLIYINDCPAQPLVPIYLVVGGVMVLVLTRLCRLSALSCCGAVVGILIGFFTLSWFIAGTVFVIQTRNAIAGCEHTMTTGGIPTPSPTQEITMTTTTTTGTADTSQFPDVNNTPILSPDSIMNGCPVCNDGLLSFAFATVILELSAMLLILVSCCCVFGLVCLCPNHYPIPWNCVDSSKYSKVWLVSDVPLYEKQDLTTYEI